MIFELPVDYTKLSGRKETKRGTVRGLILNREYLLK
jgi:hypothetical protein